MKFVCRVSEKEGIWTMEHAGSDIGPIRVTGATRAEARQKLKEEIRYWLEMCPCSGQMYRNVVIELVESDLPVVD